MTAYPDPLDGPRRRSPQVADTRDQRAVLLLFSRVRDALEAMPAEEAGPLWEAAAAGRTTWAPSYRAGDPGRVILTAYIDGTPIVSAATADLLGGDDLL